MTENITTEPIAKRLERSRSDRMLAGVCGGLARYFDMSPAFYRVGFVVLTLLGGAGILIYLAAVLVVPEEGREESIAAEVLRERREKPWQLAGLALLTGAIAVLLARATLWPSGDAAWVLVLLAGAVILWTQRRGRRLARGLAIATSVLLVLLLVAAAAVATAFHLDVGDGIGKRSYVPTIASDVHRDYRLGLGRLDLDLSRVRLTSRVTTVHAHVGIGELDVTVPAGVPVRVKAKAQAGNVDVFDRHDDGRHAGVAVPAAGARVLVLDVSAGLGQVKVERAVR